MIGGGIALLVIIIAAFGWSIYSSNRNEASQTQLSQAINAYNDPNIKDDKVRFQKTLTEAQKTYATYGSLPAGKIAQYYLALSQEGLGDTAKATANLQQVVQSGDPNIAGVAKFALAGLYKTHGDVQKASDLYKQIYDTGGYSK